MNVRLIPIRGNELFPLFRFGKLKCGVERCQKFTLMILGSMCSVLFLLSLQFYIYDYILKKFYCNTSR